MKEAGETPSSQCSPGCYSTGQWQNHQATNAVSCSLQSFRNWLMRFSAVKKWRGEWICSHLHPSPRREKGSLEGLWDLPQVDPLNCRVGRQTGPLIPSPGLSISPAFLLSDSEREQSVCSNLELTPLAWKVVSDYPSSWTWRLPWRGGGTFPPPS